MFQIRPVIVATVLAVAAPLALADAKQDADMKKLAVASGCFACHGIDQGRMVPDGKLPIGPAWADVAARYKGQPGAADALLLTVMQGSSPYSSHWKGSVSGLAMPPNAVAISEPDAKALVGWILSLAK